MRGPRINREPVIDKNGYHIYEEDPEAHRLARKRANDRLRSKKYYYELNKNPNVKKRKKVTMIFRIEKMNTGSNQFVDPDIIR